VTDPTPAELAAELPPRDVLDWVQVTYDRDGAEVWLLAWKMGDEGRRTRLVRLARMASGGT
jgi:hypothetical protein